VRRVAFIILCISAVTSTASAQPARHVEVAATASLALIEPVYLRPIVTVGSGPATAAGVGHTLDVASPGLDAAVYAGARVQVIARWSRIPARTADARLPPLPATAASCQPFSCIAVVVRTTEQRNRMIVGGAVDLASGRRVRLTAGAALQVDRVTGTQAEGVLISFHSVGGPITPRDFQAVTVKSPVLVGRIKTYPSRYLLVFADATLRLGSASGEHAPYQTSRITPTVGIGVSF